MNYGLISKFRNQLFGLSILNIIVFHFAEDVLAYEGQISNVLEMFCNLYMKVFASIGVEIFLFLSGMGLYYSLNKTKSLTVYYRKRMSRILIPYILIGGAFWAVINLVLSKGTILDWLYDFTFASFWCEGNRAIWYVGLLLILYLIFPVIYRFCENGGNRNIRLISVTLVSVILLIVVSLFFPTFIENTEVALGRILVFLMGYAFSFAVKNAKRVRLKDVVLIVVATAGFTALAKIISYQPVALLCTRWSKCFYSILLIIALCLLLKKIPVRKYYVLDFLGKYTFELYLLHVTLRVIFNAVGYPTANFVSYGIVIVISLVLALPLSKLTKALNKLFRLDS